MVNHKKPTTKELEEQAQAELAELEKEEEKEEEEDKEEEEEKEEENSEHKQEALIPSSPPQDYETKFKESSRNAQKLYGKNKIFDEAIDAIEDMPPPTDEEMEAEFSDWDIMGDSEKVIAKEAIVSRQFRKIIAEARQKAKKIENWEKSVDDFIEDPKTLVENPDLEGQEANFIKFAKQQQNSSVPFHLLVSAFIYEQGKMLQKNKGSQFEVGGGASSTKEKQTSNKISLAQAEVLKKNNYKLYKKYLIEDKIADE